VSELVLVTGATGFVGRAVVATLLRSGRRVFCPVRSDGEAAQRLRTSGAQVSVVGDFRAEALVAACSGAPDAVVHLAASGVRPDERDPRALVAGHALLTIEVLRAALQWRPRLVLDTGSWSEYGASQTALRETSPISPTSAYGVAKASATSWARHLADSGGLRLLTLCLFNVYGPHERPPRLVPTLLEAARTKEVPSLTSGRAIRDFVFVEDVAEAYLRALSLPDTVPLPAALHVATGRGTPARDVVQTVAVELDAPWLLAGLGRLSDRPDEPPSVVGSTELTDEVLGWHPATDLATGLTRTMDYEARRG